MPASVPGVPSAKVRPTGTGPRRLAGGAGFVYNRRACNGCWAGPATGVPTTELDRPRSGRTKKPGDRSSAAGGGRGLRLQSAGMQRLLGGPGHGCPDYTKAFTALPKIPVKDLRPSGGISAESGRGVQVAGSRRPRRTCALARPVGEGVHRAAENTREGLKAVGRDLRGIRPRSPGRRYGGNGGNGGNGGRTGSATAGRAGPPETGAGISQKRVPAVRIRGVMVVTAATAGTAGTAAVLDRQQRGGRGRRKRGQAFLRTSEHRAHRRDGSMPALHQRRSSRMCGTVAQMRDRARHSTCQRQLVTSEHRAHRRDGSMPALHQRRSSRMCGTVAQMRDRCRA